MALVTTRPRKLTANEVGIAGDRAAKMEANGRTHNATYRNSLAVNKFAQDNPTTQATASLYKDQSESTKAFQKRTNTTGYTVTPTVLSDTNIRDRVIPRLAQDANTTLANYDQNSALATQGAQQNKDRQFQQEQESKKNDPFSSLSDTASEQANADPFVQKQLDLIDKMMRSSDRATRAAAESQRLKFERQRSMEIQNTASAKSTLGTSLSRMGGRYTPGGASQAMSTLQSSLLETLSGIDDKETNAIEELRAAQENKDFKSVGDKLEILRDVRDERMKTLEAERKATAEAEAKKKEGINKVLESIAKNSAPADVKTAVAQAGSVEEAIQAAGNWMADDEYLSYARQAQAYGQTPVDPTTFFHKKWTDTAGSGTGESGALASGSVPFQATIENAAQFAGAADKSKTTAANQLAALAQSGDYKTLLTRMQSLGRQGLTAANRTDVETAQRQIKAMDRMDKALEAYKAAGGDVGFLKGTADQLATRIGTLATDPRFKEIATELSAAYFQYRSDMSGAAFGAQENAAYKSIFPSSDKSFELNDAVIKGLKNHYTHQVDDTYSTVLGEGYNNVKDYVDQGLTPSGKHFIDSEEKAFDLVKQIGSENPTLQAQAMQFLSENPEATSMDVLDVLGIPHTAMDQEVAIEIPETSRLAYVNNNPGNLRFADQEGARKGEGGFAAFDTPAAGFKALQNQIALDTKRGKTLSGFVSKYAPPSENNTSQYLAQATKELGVSPNTPLSQIPVEALARFMIKKESGSSLA